jgi:hypothetical protein
MMITDGQLLYESFTCTTATKGAGLVLGTGTMPDGTALMTACKYTATAGQRLVQGLNTYIRTTLGLTVLVDTSMNDVADIIYKGTMRWGFSKSQALTVASASGTPTWGMIMRPNTNASALTNGASILTQTYQRHLVIFSVGVAGSGADMILPGSGMITANQIVRLNDVIIPLSNVIC